MPQSLNDILDLELAWKRAKLDNQNRVFINNQIEVSIIEENLKEYLAGIEKQLNENNWHPKPNYICNIPKENGLIRPGSNLTIDDRIVFSAIIGACLPTIFDTLKFSKISQK